MGRCPNGWTNRFGVCGQSCKDKHPAGSWADSALGFCHHKCPLGWQRSAGVCYHPCNAYGGFETTCGPLYCSVDSAACVAKAVDIGMAFGEMLANLAGPASKAYKANKGLLKAAMKGSMRQKRLAFRAFFRKFAQALKDKMKKKLKKRMRRLATRDEDEILLGGAELVIEMHIARETDDAALRELALDLATALDPFGLLNVARSFQAPSCKDRAIDWMPVIQHRRLTGLNANSVENATIADVDDTSADPDDPDDASDVGGAENVEDAVSIDESDDAENDDTGDSEAVDAASEDEDAIGIDEPDDADNADTGNSEGVDAASNAEDASVEDTASVEDLINPVDNITSTTALNASTGTGPERRLRGSYVV